MMSNTSSEIYSLRIYPKDFNAVNNGRDNLTFKYEGMLFESLISFLLNCRCSVQKFDKFDHMVVLILIDTASC